MRLLCPILSGKWKPSLRGISMEDLTPKERGILAGLSGRDNWDNPYPALYRYRPNMFEQTNIDNWYEGFTIGEKILHSTGQVENA